ncbi:hypothetical protein GYMLUDRAFT_82987 [Collybiopsis luxurians FD-317 M1]|nr:hypothetical protein GYMLUDRAFT_82987 [Collybiopsis luxurians FD-317 M1]
MLLSPPSEKEAKSYYRGLPSDPVLVARTGTTSWKEPTGPEPYPTRNELLPVGDHALMEVWEGNLALKLQDLLGSLKTLSALEMSKTFLRPMSKSLSHTSSSGLVDGCNVASQCKKLLVEHNITDVDVEIRESEVHFLAGPKLLKPNYFSDPIGNVRELLTIALGFPICAQSTPQIQGTAGFFVTVGRNNKKLLLVTARHVVFPPGTNESQPRHNVALFGSAKFDEYFESIQTAIKDKEFTANYNQRRIKAVEGRDGAVAKRAQTGLDEANEAKKELGAFEQYVKSHWAALDNRVLGHVTLSPPIKHGVGSSREGYTEDWAVIEIDTSKIDASNFNGNVMDLGGIRRLGFTKLERMMNTLHPNSFRYPTHNGLLRLEVTVPDEDMRRSSMVIKNSSATGLTIGCTSGFFSYIRTYSENGDVETSKEWAILPFKYRPSPYSGMGMFAPFSAKGDSGSVIVDDQGRIGGLLTSGAASDHTSHMDITYATPVNFLLKRMVEHGLHEPNINPVLAA